MKKIALLLILSGLYLISMAQVERVPAPVDQDEFEVYLERIQMIKSPAGKVEMAMALAVSKNFTCRQIKEISGMLPNDKTKLQFSLKAYERAVNPNDYYLIMDSFDLRSTAFRFYDAKNTEQKPKPVSSNTQIELNKEPVNVKDPIKFPNALTYSGSVNADCSEPINSKQFAIIEQQVRNVKSPGGKLNNALQFAEKYCMSVSQIMKLASHMEDESIRYKWFSGAHDYIYDIDNFLYVRQMLETDYYKQKILVLHEPTNTEKPKPLTEGDIVNKNPDMLKNPNNECFVEAREMDEIIAVLKEESFESTRVSSAQQIIKLKKCFRTEQIIRILNCFSYESSKQDLAKYAFPYVTDKSNYYKVKDVFEFSSSKEDLDEFLNQQ
jgi:hypothetical protein